ncbi:hypothetical protein FA15DRAFT_675971 [Coprinopsis marcescibilis]|uniref:Integral membrane protein n=1 Tax=Coprinopsis marcescibilis TaxID=230819 RepID=A0A5C3KCN5_COPMA|nr:hypothetical protein FA15DRAFT_675971 [Coprinopsis marcescibilis]
MSLFLPGFWSTPRADFGLTFLFTNGVFLDNLCATLLITLFSGIHLCMTRRIVSLRIRLSRDSRPGGFRGNISTVVSAVSSVTLALMWIACAFLYCIQFSGNVISLRRFTVPDTVGDVPSDPLRAAPLESCHTTSRIPFAQRCTYTPFEDAMSSRKLELTFAALIQVILLITDLILVIRCHTIFSNKWVFYAPAVAAYLGSVAVFLFGLGSLASAGVLHDPTYTGYYLQPDSRLPRGYSTYMSIISSLIVNLTVTIPIVYKMLNARRRFKGSRASTIMGKYDMYLSITALLTESALPPAIFGIAAAVLSTYKVPYTGGIDRFAYTPKMVWLSFTALAPQLILVRVLQGRAWDTDVDSRISAVTVSVQSHRGPRFNVGKSIDSGTVEEYKPYSSKGDV